MTVSEINWREMFKGVVKRMRESGESHEMGARWLAEEAEKAVYDLLNAKKSIPSGGEGCDLIGRLRKAAVDFEGMRAYAANAEDSDCEPHYSDQSDMAEASISAIEAADAIAAKDAELAKLREDNKRLREALNGAAGKLEGLLFDGPDHPIVAKARAALKEPTP